jgi:hypothetical protein
MTTCSPPGATPGRWRRPRPPGNRPCQLERLPVDAEAELSAHERTGRGQVVAAIGDLVGALTTRTGARARARR